ncbi:DinB family protein [bacterium]|nr:DinB family protein [bacterium]
MTQTEHLDKLEKRFKRFKAVLKGLEDLQVNLEHRPGPGKWNARECLQHVVVMWDSYKPQFDKGLRKAKPKKDEFYKAGWFGNWFAGKMEPIAGGGMRTQKMWEPSNYTSDKAAVFRLMEVQDEMIEYLNKMRDLDINRSRVQSPASLLIRLKMGDALQVLANHQDRHWQQATRAMESI